MVESDQRINIEYTPEGNSLRSQYPIEETSQSIVAHSNVLSNLENEATPNEKRSRPRITSLVSLFDKGHSKKCKKPSEKPNREDENIPHIEQNNSSSKFKISNLGKSFYRQDALDSSEQINLHKKIKNCPKKHTLDGFLHLSTTHCGPEHTSESITQAITITTEPTNDHSILHPILESNNETLINNSPQKSEEICPCKNPNSIITTTEIDTSLDGYINPKDDNQLIGLLNRFSEQESLIKELCLKMTQFELKTNALLEENKVLSQDLRNVKRELERVKTVISSKQAENRIIDEQVDESTVEDEFEEILHRRSKTFDVNPKTNEELISNKMKSVKKADSQDW